MELFEQMRREYEHGEGTIKGVVRKFGVHRRMVREAIGNAIPPARKIPARERPKLARAIPFIEEMLEADRKPQVTQCRGGGWNLSTRPPQGGPPHRNGGPLTGMEGGNEMMETK